MNNFQRPVSTDDTLQRRPTLHSQVTEVLGRVTIERKGEKEKKFQKEYFMLKYWGNYGPSQYH